MKSSRSFNLKTAGLLATLALVVNLAHCKENPTADKSPEQDLAGKITFLKGTDVTVNNHPAKLGMTVGKNDWIRLKKGNMVVIQFGKNALSTLKDDCEVKVSQLAPGADGKPDIKLFQKKGFSFNKVKPGTTNFSVKSPTAVAGVRGTVFSLQIENGRTRVHLLRGKVRTTPVEKGKEVASKSVDIETGQSVELDSQKGTSKVAKISAKAEAALKAFDKVKIIDKIDEVNLNNATKLQELQPGKIIEEKALETLEKADGKDEAKAAPAPAKKKNLTLAQIKAKYGSLSVVKTKDGKKYIGAFEQKGAYMQIITTKGVVKIPSSNLAKVLPYN